MKKSLFTSRLGYYKAPFRRQFSHDRKTKKPRFLGRYLRVRAREMLEIDWRKSLLLHETRNISRHVYSTRGSGFSTRTH